MESVGFNAFVWLRLDFGSGRLSAWLGFWLGWVFGSAGFLTWLGFWLRLILDRAFVLTALGGKRLAENLLKPTRQIQLGL
jgi:hypothetical protein